MLRALAATWLTDRPHGGVEAPYERLLDVRDALHVTSGRELDRLLAAEVDEVARLLGFGEPDDLRREVSLGARRIAHAVDLTVRAARQAVPQRRVLSFGAPRAAPGVPHGRARADRLRQPGRRRGRAWPAWRPPTTRSPGSGSGRSPPARA